MDKKVNVILCTYNGQKFLPELLDSLYAQTYRNIDIYVRDDHSKDSTTEILEQYAQKEADGIRMHIIRDDQGNLGYSKNFMTVIRASGDADYYAFCDQDDYWYPNKIECAVEMMKQADEKKCVLYTSNYEVCNEKLDVVGESHPTTPVEQLDVGKSLSLYDGGWLLGFTLVMNKALKQKAFDQEVGPFYSHDIWVQAVTTGFKGNLLIDKRITCKFRRHGNTTSVAESSVNKSAIEQWKYRLNEFLGNGKMFVSIRNSINSYAAAYADQLPSAQDKDFLRRFADRGDGRKHRIAKLCYPHRLKKSALAEIAWRLSILFGKI